ncbi:hypothetical protein [Nonomuraea insulae]|uniref:Uncharacterized protein n=1 Tax=Nonomuraea insulae TaxID=1616787 RepID=A0ABW1CED4_9ACTN
MQQVTNGLEASVARLREAQWFLRGASELRDDDLEQQTGAGAVGRVVVADHRQVRLAHQRTGHEH